MKLRIGLNVGDLILENVTVSGNTTGRGGDGYGAYTDTFTIDFGYGRTEIEFEVPDSEIILLARLENSTAPATTGLVRWAGGKAAAR